MIVEIHDGLQELKNAEKYTFIRDIVLGGLVFFLYKNIPTPAFITLVYYYIVFIILRFVLSEITTLKIVDGERKGKKYFALSGHVALFTLCIYMSLQHNLFHKWIGLSALIAYCILTVSVRAHFTADVINTVLLVFWNVTFLKKYFDV